MTPARIASLAVVLVLTIVMVPLRADDGHLVNALIVWLIGSAALVAGAWFAPLARAEGTMGGTPRAPWRPEYEGPKTTQVAGGGLVALLVGLITGGAPFVGPLLGIVAAVAAGRFLHIPSAAEVEAVVGSQEQEQEQEQVDDDGDGGAAFDTAPVPVVEAPGSGPTAEVHGSTAAPAADEADRTP